ncbi:glycosyltransferase [Marinimicrobium agarilyticum]|uniref:glycosyltransferase n=1 Tax=Marinimicrobium agarilyticum TaxID=306546 RepID=UPI0004852FBF|nr:glycosyltransferase [Marinimicrobium agarilyticum]
MESLLWGGFSDDGLFTLKAKLQSPSQSRQERAYAAWALARWAAFHREYDEALLRIQQQRFLDPNAASGKASRLMLIDCLNRMGRPDEALGHLDSLPKAEQCDVDLLLARANGLISCADVGFESDWLASVNQALAQSGFSMVDRRDKSNAISIFNIACYGVPVLPQVQLQQAKVSIVMPAYNAAHQIGLAIRSLQEQNWTNLEILVADDCSTDETQEVVARLAKNDPRIVLLSTPHNGGAYAARNTALAQATGDFISVHDSDDWSHAQKLQVQVEHLLNNPGCVATLTDWARAREDLYFTGTFRAHGSLVSENTSSLMFRREVVDELGGWGLARTSADSEYVMRICCRYGDEAVERLYKGVPLAFALDQETSLTRTPVTHAKTLFYGARREFREAAQAWHEQAGPERLRVPLGNPTLPFPMPSVMETKRTNKPREYDLVVISDFNLSGGAYISTMHYVNAAVGHGLRVALFHWRRADLDVKTRLRPELRAQAREGRFDILAAGESVVAKTVIVGYPVVLNYRLDSLPEIKTERFAILVNQMASRLTTGEDPQYDPRRIQANVKALFGLEPVWVPISGYVRRLMWEDGRYPVPHEEPWNPLLDLENWCQFRVQWRGDERAKPVIGRHSRDHYTKWPVTRAALEAAYCVNRDCEIRLLGGADHALSVLGYRPDNWVVEGYVDTTHEFLQELDFFVHFPHEEYIEEFGRAVLEAMGLGIPAILPPVFKDTFGEYALYAEPEEVWPLIDRLWADQGAYQAAADKALEFVRRFAGYDVLEARLGRLP